MLPHLHLMHLPPLLLARLRRRVAFGLGALLVAALVWLAWSHYTAPLPPPAEAGELVVATLVSPGLFMRETTDGDQPLESGADHDLAAEFAKSLGLPARFIVAADAFELVELVATGRAHMAMSLPIGNGELTFSQPVRGSEPWLVGRDDALEPGEPAALAARPIEVVAGSPLADTLRGLGIDPPPQVIEVPEIDEMGLLARVAAGRTPLAAVHDIHLDLANNFYPQLKPLLRLPGRIELGWGFARHGGKPLVAQADEFIARARQDGLMARIDDRYFGHIKRVDNAGISRFLDDMRTRLPAFRRYFQAAQELTGLDWRLIAALAYQESHWDPLATSPTNVRGIMMLTEETADHLGVKNRLDAAESIHAGARYLAELIDQLPGKAKPPDRLWLGLAAYNLGMGHLRGAQAIARGMKRDPDSWYDMKQVLPQLARPEIAARLKSGPARGGEAVILADNVHTYYDILSRFEPPYATPFPRPLMQR